MSKDSIKLSPKYGVNATIPICFFCGKEKNEIALLGKIGKRDEDIEAPKNMLIDYEPCESCKALMAQGITLIAVSEHENTKNQPPIHKGLYPTGSWSVMKREAFERIFNDKIEEDVMADTLEKGNVLVSESIIQQLNAMDAEAKSESENN